MGNIYRNAGTDKTQAASRALRRAPGTATFWARTSASVSIGLSMQQPPDLMDQIMVFLDDLESSEHIAMIYLIRSPDFGGSVRCS
jgi:hypothetical protein